MSEEIPSNSLQLEMIYRGEASGCKPLHLELGHFDAASREKVIEHLRQWKLAGASPAEILVQMVLFLPHRRSNSDGLRAEVTGFFATFAITRVNFLFTNLVNERRRPKSPAAEPLRLGCVVSSLMRRKATLRLLRGISEVRIEFEADSLEGLASTLLPGACDVLVADASDGMLPELVEVAAKAEIPVVAIVDEGGGEDQAAVARCLGVGDVLVWPGNGDPEIFTERAAVLFAGLGLSDRSGERRRRVPRVAYDPRTVIAIGSSTGGPQALSTLLSALPDDIPPVVIVQHISENFSAVLADRLNAMQPFRVIEARGDEILQPRTVYIAPGGSHLSVRGSARGPCRLRLDDSPAERNHRPAVNVLFRSLVAVSPKQCVAVILTGMGQDGAAGMQLLRQAGARTVAQDEKTSTVFGMPRAAIELGCVDYVEPIERIGARVMRLVAEVERCGGD